jgi:hypothetical protein
VAAELEVVGASGWTWAELAALGALGVGEAAGVDRGMGRGKRASGRARIRNGR